MQQARFGMQRAGFGMQRAGFRMQRAELNAALPQGYVSEGISGYVWTSP
jgi:hypothetical protein